MLKEILDIQRRRLKKVLDEDVVVKTLASSEVHLICEVKWKNSDVTEFTRVLEVDDRFGNTLEYCKLSTRMCLYISDNGPSTVKKRLDRLMSSLSYVPVSRVEGHPILTAAGDNEVGDGLFALYKHKLIKNRLLVVSIAKSKNKKKRRRR